MTANKNTVGISVALFVLVFGTYAYFTHPGDPGLFNSNELVRFLTAKSIVLDRSAAIGKYSASGLDMALFEGRYFSGKAPGLSLAAAPFYALARAVSGRVPPDGAALYILRVVTVSLPAALFALLLLRFARRLGPPEGESLLLVAGYCLGTMAFAYAVVFLGHQPAAILVFTSLLALLKWRRENGESRAAALGAGLLGGLAVAFEYPAALLVLIIALVAFFPYRRAGAMGCFILGLLPGAAIVLGYNWICFGGPLSFPYSHEAMPIAKKVQSTGLFGVALPSLRPFLMLLASPFRGLFFVSPFLVLCVPGLVSLWKARGDRGFDARVGMGPARLFVLSVAAIVCYLLFNSSYLAWSGGAAYGPRHLVPVLPFFLIPIAVLLRAHPREYLWPTIILVGYSVLFTLVAVAGGPEAHEYLRNPVRETALPFVLTGNIRWNLGYAAGLTGAASLIPLGALWLACLGYLFRAPGKWSAEARRSLGLSGRLLRSAVCGFAGLMAVLFALHRTTESAYRHAVIGHGYDIRGDDGRAAECFENSLALDPRDPLVLRDYGRLAARQGNYPLALDLQVRLLATGAGGREAQRRVEILFRLNDLARQLGNKPGDPEILEEISVLRTSLFQ